MLSVYFTPRKKNYVQMHVLIFGSRISKRKFVFEINNGVDRTKLKINGEKDHKSYSWILSCCWWWWTVIFSLFRLTFFIWKKWNCLLLVDHSFLFNSCRRSTISHRMKVHFVRANLFWFDSCGIIPTVLLHNMSKSRFPSIWSNVRYFFFNM